MNLYEVTLVHYAPKDSEQGIFTYLVASSDEEVYEWLKSDPELSDGRRIYTGYAEKEDDIYDIYDDNYDIVGEESFKERMIRLCGDMNDEDVELNDLYYGMTLFGWKLKRENISQKDIDLIKGLGVCIESK